MNNQATISEHPVKDRIIYQSESILGACDNERKTNVWSTDKFSKDMHTAVSVAFSVLPSLQSKMAKIALIYSLIADPPEGVGAKR